MPWLWRRLAAVPLTRSLAWEPPYASRAALKSKKKKKKKKKEREREMTSSAGVLGWELVLPSLWNRTAPFQALFSSQVLRAAEPTRHPASQGLVLIQTLKSAQSSIWTQLCDFQTSSSRGGRREMGGQGCFCGLCSY